MTRDADEHGAHVSRLLAGAARTIAAVRIAGWSRRTAPVTPARHFDRTFALTNRLLHRRFPLIGAGTGWWSLVHIDDAATATAIAVERGEPGIYNIVDDEPAQVADWLPALAAAVGGKPPRRIPKWLGRPLAGSHLVTLMTETRAGSNAKAKRILGWQPRYPSWRTGFPAALRARGDHANR